MSDFIVILCTVSSKDEANKIAGSLVQKGLAACANIIDGISSIYEWKGEICKDEENLMIIKSRRSLLEEIKKEILSLHSYELPEIVSLPITDGLEPYLDWIKENTGLQM